MSDNEHIDWFAGLDIDRIVGGGDQLTADSDAAREHMAAMMVEVMNVGINSPAAAQGVYLEP